VTPRDAVERPEAPDTGTVLTPGLDPAGLVEAIETADAAGRAVDFIVSTVRLHHDWAGVRMPR
jgi:UDP-N-acetylglucosamine 2-epimerase (non-hydrolysing)